MRYIGLSEWPDILGKFLTKIRVGGPDQPLARFERSLPFQVLSKLVEECIEIRATFQDIRDTIRHLDDQEPKLEALHGKACEALARLKRGAVGEADGGAEWKDRYNEARQTLVALDGKLVEITEQRFYLRDEAEILLVHRFSDLFRQHGVDLSGVRDILLQLSSLVEEVVELRDKAVEFDDEHAMQMLRLVASVANWLGNASHEVTQELAEIDGTVKAIVKDMRDNYGKSVALTLDYGEEARKLKTVLLNPKPANGPA